MKKEIDKKYNHTKVESDKYSFWLTHNLFNPNLLSNKKSFSIILPPPNVTGHLHLGHAWDTSYQDMLIRYKKLRGYNTFWVPGTDHAGIATQTKFEKHLKETENLTRDELGRDKFLDKLWDWKESQANFIRSQWKKLGLALAYKYEKFTMDADVNLAVNKVFVDLFNKGLIYQKKKMVNWDPVLKTAISNIEVVYKPTKSKMYYLKYFTEDKSEYIVVATTRPETMFGDVCLVANPEDERYLKYKNTKFINPANNELLPVIYNDYIDKDFGTGIMKCTPAHDFNDNELANIHNLELINILNEDGTMNDIAKEYQGLDRFVCREKLISNLQKANLVEKIEDIENNIGYSERTNVIVEPYMSNQWFVKMEPLAKKVIEIQNSENKVEFIPNRFDSTLLVWLNYIDDWCISRQLWWGHQIPIWYHKDTNEIYCGIQEPNDKENWVRDESVLDTWFSSGLWPLVTLNWPKTKNKLFKKFFPTDVLVTGYDIIFFWVCRMLTMSQENQNSIPFKEVLIHGLIRDEQGRKMSKSLGNGIDPMDVIDEYGADSLRLFLTSSSTLGEDLNYSNTKVASNWNFLNKLWNGYRYISQLVENNNFKLNLKIKPEKLSIIDYYILSSLNEMVKNVTNNYDNYNFVVATKELVSFIWDKFNNTYLELTKFDIKNNNLYCLNVLCFVLKQLIIMLHPQAPFITEEIYQSLFKNKKSIMLETWPKHVKVLKNSLNHKLSNYLFEIIEVAKKIRVEHNLLNKDILELHISEINHESYSVLVKNMNKLNIYLDGLNIKLLFDKKHNKNSMTYICENFKFEFIKEVDLESELNNLLKQKEKAEFEYNRAKKILENPEFIKKASSSKIEVEKEKLIKYKTQLDSITNQIKDLKNEIN